MNDFTIGSLWRHRPISRVRPAQAWPNASQAPSATWPRCAEGSTLFALGPQLLPALSIGVQLRLTLFELAQATQRRRVDCAFRHNHPIPAKRRETARRKAHVALTTSKRRVRRAYGRAEDVVNCSHRFPSLCVIKGALCHSGRPVEDYAGRIVTADARCSAAFRPARWRVIRCVVAAIASITSSHEPSPFETFVA